MNKWLRERTAILSEQRSMRLTKIQAFGQHTGHTCRHLFTIGFEHRTSHGGHGGLTWQKVQDLQTLHVALQRNNQTIGPSFLAKMTTVLQASMRSTSCLRRLMSFHGLQNSIPAITRCIPDTASFHAASTISSKEVRTSDQRPQWFREGSLCFSTDTGNSQESSSTGGASHFQRILQHPSTEFGSEGSASSIPEEEPEAGDSDAEGDGASAQELRDRLLKAALGHVVSYIPT